MKQQTQQITKNKKAYFDYEIIKSYECGIELEGHEVKSIREGHINLKGSYVVAHGNQVYAKGVHISPWKALSNRESIITDKERKLFLHKKDILFLTGKLRESGYSVIPLSVYLKGSLIKISIGLAKGKKKFEKKQILKERTLDKEAHKAMKKFI